MNLKLGTGLTPIKFGFTQNEVVSLIGKPKKERTNKFSDGSRDIVLEYNHPKICLTFSSDDEFKLSSIDIEEEGIPVEDVRLIGKDLNWILYNLEPKIKNKPIIESISTIESPNLLLLNYQKIGLLITFVDYICVSYSISPFWKNKNEIKWPK